LGRDELRAGRSHGQSEELKSEKPKGSYQADALSTLDTAPRAKMVKARAMRSLCSIIVLLFSMSLVCGPSHGRKRTLPSENRKLTVFE
jgi:hypothetical protein